MIAEIIYLSTGHTAIIPSDSYQDKIVEIYESMVESGFTNMVIGNYYVPEDCIIIFN